MISLQKLTSRTITPTLTKLIQEIFEDQVFSSCLEFSNKYHSIKKENYKIRRTRDLLKISMNLLVVQAKKWH